MVQSSFLPIYCIDTDALSEGHRIQDIGQLLENLAKAGRLKAPITVLNELNLGYEERSRWAKNLGNEVFIELTPGSAIRAGDLVEKYRDPFTDNNNPGITYPGLIKGEDAHDADPEVIALAMEFGWTVVTKDRGIQGACKLEQIRCLTPQDLLLEERGG
jgi:predicted nucleic acid-binding protein